MYKQQVMFVETPQQQVLDSLKSRLMSTHAEWQIVFMADATAALDLIAQRKVSIVLANFGMDTVSCEAFFNSLRNNMPEVIRIGLLPDQAKQNVINSLEYAHECIPEHCDISQMEIVIARSLHVWERVHSNPRLVELMSNLHTIPTPPTLYFDIRDELESPGGTARSVAQIIAKDPAITAKLLKVSNAGFYASPRTIVNLDEAIILLGMNLVLALVLSAHLYDQLPLPGLKLDELWKHSLAVSTLAREIASSEQGSQTIISSCAISGLLHDLGQLIFMVNFPRTYYPLVRQASGDEKKLLQMELEEFGIGHPEVGALILSLWDLPNDVVQAINNHHMEDLHSLLDESLTTRAVCIAERMLHGQHLQEGASLTDSVGDVDTPEMLEGLVQWKPLMQKLVEQGLIKPLRNSVKTLSA